MPGRAPLEVLMNGWLVAELARALPDCVEHAVPVNLLSRQIAGTATACSSASAGVGPGRDPILEARQLKSDGP